MRPFHALDGFVRTLLTFFECIGRADQAFDLAGITNTVGARFLRVFCERSGTVEEWTSA